MKTAEFVTLSSLLQKFGFSSVHLFKEWAKAKGLKMVKVKAPVVDAPWRNHWHLAFAASDAEKANDIRMRELDETPGAVTFFTVKEAATMMGITREELEKKITSGAVDVFIDGRWLKRYLNRGRW